VAVRVNPTPVPECTHAVPKASLGTSLSAKYFELLARPKRFELLTPRFVVWRGAESGSQSIGLVIVVRLFATHGLDAEVDPRRLRPQDWADVRMASELSGLPPKHQVSAGRCGCAPLSADVYWTRVGREGRLVSQVFEIIGAP
jgi:hypothetical protein